MTEFVSEPIVPLDTAFDTAAMARGEPGLPRGFLRAGVPHHIVAVLERYKQSSPEGGRAGGELYLRRHCFRLLMSDRSIWNVYFLRQAPRAGSPKRRWFLYSIETADAE